MAGPAPGLSATILSPLCAADSAISVRRIRPCTAPKTRCLLEIRCDSAYPGRGGEGRGGEGRGGEGRGGEGRGGEGRGGEGRGGEGRGGEGRGGEGRGGEGRGGEGRGGEGRGGEGMSGPAVAEAREPSRILHLHSFSSCF